MIEHMSKPLIIVESPTKAKTITKFLGKDYQILSSFGHIRDLPKSKIGVDPAYDFSPTYVVPPEKKKHVTELKTAAKGASEVMLATDADREGEAIAWHIAEILGLDEEKAKRITFHEITHKAITEALEHPRTLSMDLVNAQQARRILDRLVGYELSPLLWQKVRRGLSAGRVQSVALRLVVERERERQAFKAEEYWTIDALFTKEGKDVEAKLVVADGKKLEKLDINNAELANRLAAELRAATFTIANIEHKLMARTAPAPFTTSALQIEGNHKLGFSAKQTMMLAQSLYETGRITYMRTDSVNISEAFLSETQAFIRNTFGDAYATGPKRYTTKSKGAQEAHEAIRPTHADATPESLKDELEVREWKLYDLIWRRTVASQLPPAQLERTSVDIAAKNHVLRATGNMVRFDGYMKVYRSTQEKILPKLEKGEALPLKELHANQHFTEPPPRYSDATLVKILEEHGIGRPSTYAPTISTIIDRGYVERDEQKKLFPTETAMIVTDLLKEHFPSIVDYEFTATMEKSLDNIAEGKQEWVPMLKSFYGPFHANIVEKTKHLKREDILKERVIGDDPKTGLSVIVRSGRFGPFVQLGEWSEEDKKAKKNKPRSASLEKNMNMDTVTLEEAMKLMELPKVLGTTDAGDEIIVAVGRFGPYISAKSALGGSGGKAHTVSIPATISPHTVTLEDAKRLLVEGAERRQAMMTPLLELGEDPTSKQPILVKQGRFGPYVTDGKTNASVPKKIDPTMLTREEAIQILEKKRAAPKRNWKRKAKTEKTDA